MIHKGNLSIYLNSFGLDKYFLAKTACKDVTQDSRVNIAIVSEQFVLMLSLLVSGLSKWQVVGTQLSPTPVPTPPQEESLKKKPLKASHGPGLLSLVAYADDSDSDSDA